MSGANHNRRAERSPKIRSKVGVRLSRSRSVSLTSKTIKGRSDMDDLRFTVFSQTVVAATASRITSTTCSGGTEIAADDLRVLSTAALDPGCVKTPRTRKREE